MLNTSTKVNPFLAPAALPAAAVPARNKQMAEAFLDALAPGADSHTLLTLSDTQTGRCRKEFHGALGDYWQQQVVVLNTPAAGYGAFVCINETDGRGRRRDNIVRPRALFVDADGPDQIARVCADIRAGFARPTIMVSTSPGRAHFFWKRDDLTLENFTRLQKALAHRFGTDSSVSDLPRVMRLPGTLHLKNPANPYLVKLVYPNVTR